MPNVKEIGNTICKSAIKHSAEILTCLGVAGAAGAVIFAWNEAPKAERIIKENRKEAAAHNVEYKKIDAIKDTWRCWGPPMAMFAMSTACIIGASTVNHKRNAALAAAYTLSEKTFLDYRKHVIDSIGEEAGKAIDTTIATENAKENIEESKAVVFVEGDDDILCYDDYSKQWFYSTRNKIEKAMNKCNARMINGMEMYCSVNEFYDEINGRGLKSIGSGDSEGWNINKNGAIDIITKGDLREDGKPYLVMTFFNKPMSSFTSIY